MTILPAYEIVLLVTYWQKQTLVGHAGAVKPASCFNSGLHLCLVYADSKGSGESTLLHMLT